VSCIAAGENDQKVFSKFRVCRSVHFHTLKLIKQLDAAINYRFIARNMLSGI